VLEGCLERLLREPMAPETAEKAKCEAKTFTSSLPLYFTTYIKLIINMSNNINIPGLKINGICPSYPSLFHVDNRHIAQVTDQGHKEILSKEALEFLVKLHRTFEPVRQQLLAARKVEQER
jgi:hypothetical protein